MSTALERHLRREFTPFTLCSPADVKGEDVLRILLYQDKKQMPILPTLQKALGTRQPSCMRSALHRIRWCLPRALSQAVLCSTPSALPPAMPPSS